LLCLIFIFFFSSRRRHTRWPRDWSSDVCSSDLSYPGNIGAAARAMKAMGLDDLRLVAPERFPAPEAEWMATSAVDVLQRARIHPSLHDAIKDCVAAFALSARPREWSPQVLDVRAAVVRAMELANDVAFVFGNETAGLTNEEMFACQFLVHIP